MNMTHTEISSLDVYQTQEVCGQRREVWQLRPLIVRQRECWVHSGGGVAVRGGTVVKEELEVGRVEHGQQIRVGQSCLCVAEDGAQQRFLVRHSFSDLIINAAAEKSSSLKWKSIRLCIWQGVSTILEL